MYTTTSCIPFLSCARPQLELCILYQAILRVIHLHSLKTPWPSGTSFASRAGGPGFNTRSELYFCTIVQSFFFFYFVFVLFQRSHVAVCNINYFRTMKRNWVNTTGHVKEVDPGFQKGGGVYLFLLLFFFLFNRKDGGVTKTLVGLIFNSVRISYYTPLENMGERVRVIRGIPPEHFLENKYKIVQSKRFWWTLHTVIVFMPQEGLYFPFINYV